MRFEPLGDQAAMAFCDDEQQAVAFAAQVRRDNSPWLIDVVQAYVSVAVYYDLSRIDFHGAAQWLGGLAPGGKLESDARLVRRHVIPCCYEYGLDFERIDEHTGLSRADVVALHVGTPYTVYAIGFCPGFPYLGYLPAALTGVPRLASPRLEVEVGSVGMTGRQTGIYTEPRPGGWNLIGKTPLQLVDVKDGYFPLRTGDEVRFRAIDAKEFEDLRGQRLPLAA